MKGTVIAVIMSILFACTVFLILFAEEAQSGDMGELYLFTPVNVVQHCLDTLGYDPDPVGEAISERTMLALEHFQSKNGLPLTRALNLETLTLMLNQAGF